MTGPTLLSLPLAQVGLAAGSLLAFILAYLYHAQRPRSKSASSASPSRSGASTPAQTSVTPKGSGWLAVAPDGRDWGHWVPSEFRMPEIQPDVDFDIETTPSPVYRAWKYKHTVIMDARNMPWNAWIELDKDFPRYHSLRAERIKERGKRLYGTLPGAEKAVQELLLELAEFLSQRYPTVYSVTRRTGTEGSWFDEPNEICAIEIPDLGVKYDFDSMDAMEIAGMITPTDLAVMMEGEDSMYYMRAGFIALAGSWRFEDKIGKDLHYIHMTGHVPEYKTKLDLPMTRYFQKLRPETPGWRNNYTFTVDRGADELAWSSSTNGPEDVYDQTTKGPHPDSKAAGTFALPEPVTDPTKIQIRQERQTLRRLPRTGAIVFTVHSYSEPVTAIAAEPGVPGRLATSIRSWKGEVHTHKNGDLYKELLIPYLEDLHKKQVEQGLTTDGPDPEWKYPY